MSKNIIAALDLGTTKVCVVIAEKEGSGRFRILGSGHARSEGLHKGLVLNISKTTEAINRAVDIACNKADMKITTVNVGVAGEHIFSVRQPNYVNITNTEREISEHDLKRLEHDIRTYPVPVGKEILHIIPEEYIVDGNGGITNPLGMYGYKLEAMNHIVMASTAAMLNIKKSVERAGLNVGSYILQPLASSAAVLEESERDMGVLLIDIGGGTTDIAIIHKGAIKHSRVFGVAGNHVTNDVREALGVVVEEAEKLKKEYGFATQESIVDDREILVKGVGAIGHNRIPISLLTQIINLRMKELFTIIDNDITATGLKSSIKAGIIITGGGCQLQGTCELAEEVFGIPARIGVPLDSLTMNGQDIRRPEFATVVGLYAGIASKVEEVPAQQEVTEESNRSGENPEKKSKAGLFSRIKETLKNF